MVLPIDEVPVTSYDTSYVPLEFMVLANTFGIKVTIKMDNNTNVIEIFFINFYENSIKSFLIIQIV